MRDQKGEVLTAVMIGMMAVMMLFGGMHFMHRENRCGCDHAQTGQKQGANDSMHDKDSHEHDHGIVPDQKVKPQ